MIETIEPVAEFCITSRLSNFNPITGFSCYEMMREDARVRGRLYRDSSQYMDGVSFGAESNETNPNSK